VTNTSRDLGARSGPLAGVAAVGSLVTSALHSLALTADGKREATDVAPHRDVFLAGGPRYMASFGIFAGCLSLAGRRTGRLPEPLATAGLVAAVAGMLSPLSLIIGPAVRLIPAVRTSGRVVTGAVGVLLGRSGRVGRESP
jgi:membrane protease YdiL (CAAX protease family)